MFPTQVPSERFVSRSAGWQRSVQQGDQRVEFALPRSAASNNDCAPTFDHTDWQPYLQPGLIGLDGLRSTARFILVRNAQGKRGAVYEDTPNARAKVAQLHAAHPVALGRIFVAPRSRLQALWAQAMAGRLTAYAQNHLNRTQPSMSARETLKIWQKGICLLLVIGACFWSVLAPHSLFLQLNILFAFLYMSIGAARFYAVFSPPVDEENQLLPKTRAADDLLPLYSIMIPLYDEAAVIPQLVASLKALDYPADKLDILILLEGDDVSSQNALAQQGLPDHMAVIVVPPSKPRTKPKALMFALPLTRGTFVTVYDAEDRPEPDQLRKAVAAFATGNFKHRDALGCVQASLNITNGQSSFLTRHFALEYMALFDAFLPALTKLGLPIPLGGTSNHFRRDALVRSGGWDPYNVTEDADLGIRLARLGYATKMIASTTYENAPTQFRPWIKQRSRWFKGWWQTWLVHMRAPLRLLNDLGLVGFFAFQIIMLGVLVSVLIHPVFLLVALGVLSGLIGPLYGSAPASEQVFMTLNLTNLTLGYLAAVALAMVGAERRNTRVGLGCPGSGPMRQFRLNG